MQLARAGVRRSCGHAVWALNAWFDLVLILRPKTSVCVDAKGKGTYREGAWKGPREYTQGGEKKERECGHVWPLAGLRLVLPNG